MTIPLLSNCPICGGSLLPQFGMPQLSIQKCRVCAHRIATHRADATSPVDYHQQYDQGTFLDSLRATRLRQAHRIIRTIRRVLPDGDRILDFGAGRGWFLDVCRESGMRSRCSGHLAVGREDSERPTEGIVGLLLNDNGQGFDPNAVPFAPRVLTFLDVIEHFPPAQLHRRIERSRESHAIGRSCCNKSANIHRDRYMSIASLMARLVFPARLGSYTRWGPRLRITTTFRAIRCCSYSSAAGSGRWSFLGTLISSLECCRIAFTS